MSESKPRISIVGLGLIGSSMGLAIRQADVASAVIGHDKDAGVSKKAKKLGAVDSTEWNLISATEESDLVILSIPVGGIEETLKAIAPYMKPGCVIVDTASIKVPVLAWADEILPEQVHFVGMDPIVGGSRSTDGGPDAARADLFQEQVFCLVPSTKANADVVKLASDLITVLGASPLFMDAAEHDGLMGAVDQLPPIIALALLNTLVSQPAWRELRKVAGSAFETATHLSSADPETYSSLFIRNRDNVVRWIDALTTSLASIRQDLVDGEEEVLADRFEKLMEERNRWLFDRKSGNWETIKGTEMPPKPNFIVDTFLGGLGRKRSDKDKREDKS